MTNNSNKTDTHIYNIINNPSPAFTEPCEACGVSEFQIGVRHERKRILDGLHSKRRQLEQLLILAKSEGKAQYIELVETRVIDVDNFIVLVEGEQKPIHTHDIEVFGSPCDCGTRHEYCGECDWVEPCEPEGEQK